MNRFSFFLSFVVTAVGLLPSLALASAFEATEISTLEMISGPDGGAMAIFQNTGLVIDDVAGCSYTHYNFSTSASQTYTGYQALVEAVIDGMAAASAGTLTSTSEGIVAENAVNGNPLGKYFTIGMATSAQLGTQTTFGGIPLTDSSNQVVLRETYFGDANLDGSVTTSDYTMWANGYSYPSSYPDSWVNGDFNYAGLVTRTDYTIWANSYSANLPPLGVSNGPVQLGTIEPEQNLPEPATPALCLAAAVCLAAFGFRKRGRILGDSPSRLSRAGNILKKCFLPSVVLAALTAAAARGGDLCDFSLLPDAVYTDSSESALLSGAAINGSNVTLPTGTKSAYVTMAIVATINNGSAQPISNDGIAWAFLNLVGSPSGGGIGGNLMNPNGAGIGAEVNNGTMGVPHGNPGANVGFYGNHQPYWTTLTASPVQAYAGTTSPSSSQPVEWPENFAAGLGAGGGENTAPLVIGVAGSAPEASTDEQSNFFAVFSAPSVPAASRLVSYSSATSYTISTVNGTAIQPGTAATEFLRGASGIIAPSATFILGEVDYNLTATSGGTMTLAANPANLSGIFGGTNADFLADGVAVESAFQTATFGTTGVVTGSGPAVEVIVPEAVPEPGALALLLAGLAGAGAAYFRGKVATA